MFLCCIWKRVWRLTKHQVKERKAEKRQKKFLKEKQDLENYDTSADEHEIVDAEVDAGDFNDKQEFKRTTFPFPSMPFSTSNRILSASVYVIYTYDVLNIFMYIYTANMTTVDIPLIGRPNGVLFDFAIQIIHVLLIGIKFYPILIVADMDPYAIVYFSASIYMGIIWTLKLFTKGFCSRTEAFVKRTLKKLSTDVGSVYRYKGSKLKNATNTVMGLFSDDPDPNAKYLNALKKGIPSVFKEYFGKYDTNEAKNILLANNEDLILTNDNTLGYTSSNRYYLEDLIGTTTTTTAASSTTTSFAYRDRLKNKTQTAGNNFMDILSERNAVSEMVINILENLPLYLTISFLLARFIILFFGCVVDLIKDKCSKKNEDDLSDNFFDEYLDNSNELLTEESRSRISRGIDQYLANLDYESENHFTSKIQREKQNHNYNYIRRLIVKIKFFDYKSCSQIHKSKSNPIRKTITKQISWVWYFIETYIYKNVPYMKYSKQFINTYTVAFMVIYFFTLFGFRLSNLFGNAIVVSIELMYRFVFRG